MSGDAFCFVHAADLHLDTPFSGLAAIAPHVAGELREASLHAFEAIVELALERGVAFALFAGDIYDGPERGLRAQLRFRDGLERLAAAGVESFVVHGNHDPLHSGWSAISTWPAGVTIFGPNEPTVVPVRRDGTQIATVQGISYAQRAETENLALRLRRPAGPGVHIGLLHCNLEGAGGEHANYSPCSLDDLRRSGLDYLALGHVHALMIHAGATSGDPWVVYPGTSQARSARAGELGAKGAVVATVRDGAIASVEFVACDAVRFGIAEVEITALADLAALVDACEDAGRRALEEADGRALVLRARIGGAGTLHGALARPGVREELVRALRDRADALRPLLWWDALIDDSRPLLDLGALRGRGDFSADLLAVADALRAEPGAAAVLLGEIGLPPRSMLRAYEDALDSDTLEALVETATDIALTALQIEDA